MKFYVYAMFGLLVSTSYAMADENTANVDIKIGKFFGTIKKNASMVEIHMNTKNAYGFNGEPKTDSDRAEVKRINEKLEKDISTIIAFEGLTCSYTENEIMVKFHMSELAAKYKVVCNEDMRGHNVNMDFSDFHDIQQINFKSENLRARKVTIHDNTGSIRIL